MPASAVPSRPSSTVTRVVLSTLVACSALLASPGLGAQARWTYASSDHFDVYTTGNERRARDILVYFERVHSFFASALKLEPTPRHKTRLIVFSNDREFRPYSINEFATAYYAPGPDRDYIVMRAFDSESYPIVVHEYVHLTARHGGAMFPVWFNEGLAEYFSTMQPEGGRMSVGHVPAGRLRELTNGGPMIPIARLLAVDRQSPEYTARNHAGMFYAQSWALTHMIMVADGYREKSGAFVSSLAQGVAAESAFATIYGKRIDEVHADLRSYVTSAYYYFFSVNYRDPSAAITSPSRSATSFEAGLVMANLLADRQGRTDDARAAYEKLAQERPDDPDLTDARALFEVRRGGPEAARPFLTSAVAAKSRNPAVYRWASLIAASPAERTSLLETGVSMDPDDIELRLLYAGALLSNRNAEDARAALAPVTRVPSEYAFQYLDLKANLHAQLGQFDDARAAAVEAQQHARPGVEASRAAQLLKSIDDFLARRAAAQRTIQPGASESRPTSASASTSTSTAARSDLTGETLTITAGRIRNLLCASVPVIMEIATDGGLLRLVLDDPLKVRIQGAGGVTTDLTCGTQDTPVKVGYAPDADIARKTASMLRLLDFR